MHITRTTQKPSAALAASLAQQNLTRYENSHPGLADWWRGAQHGTLALTYRNIVAAGGQLTPAQLALVPSKN